ncbi:MAG: PQQ-binding-like beta-propeller repeat protein [Candidatus Brocadiia bacterium]
MTVGQTRNQDPGTRRWYRAAVATAVVAGMFTAVVLGVMIAHQPAADKLRDSAKLARMKEKLYENPEDEELRERLRAYDAELRERYFAWQRLNARGTYLLLAGIAVLLVALKSAATLRAPPPMPATGEGRGAQEQRALARARWAVGACGVALGLGGLALALGSATILTEDQVRATTETEPARRADATDDAPRRQRGGSPTTITRSFDVPPLPSREQYEKNWPRFRGPGGLGVSPYTNIPISWNLETGENVLWRVALPIDGPNSPIRWGDRLFLAGARKTDGGVRCSVCCIHADTGELLWLRSFVFAPPEGEELPYVMESTGFAAPTMASDGRWVVAIFGTGSLVCYDFQGNEVWRKHLGIPENSYGHASSLLTHGELLLVLFDQGLAEDKNSSLLAFDTATGEQVWEAEREMPNTWSTPIVVPAEGRSEVVVCGPPWLIAYDPQGGEELWRADVLGGEVAPSPVFAGGRIFVANTGSYAAAVRPGGSGDVTKSHVAWTAEDGLPSICSPLTNGEVVFLLPSDGYLTCLGAATGKVLWEHDLEAPFSSSPSLVGRRVYLFSEKGGAFIVEAAREYRQVAKLEVGEQVRAVPAFGDGRMYVRGEKHLLCIAHKEKAEEEAEGDDEP